MDTSIKIRELRARQRWSQDDLAKRLGVDRSTVSRIENGQPLSGSVAILLENLVSASDAGTAA